MSGFRIAKNVLGDWARYGDNPKHFFSHKNRGAERHRSFTAHHDECSVSTGKVLQEKVLAAVIDACMRAAHQSIAFEGVGGIGAAKCDFFFQ